MGTTELFIGEIHQALEARMPGWQVVEGGIAGPRGTAVNVSVDEVDGSFVAGIVFFLNREQADVEPIVDWTTAPNDQEASVRWAVDQWVQTTLNPILEMFQQQGTLAFHSDGNDGIGVVGRHSVLGDLVGFEGIPGTGQAMRDWFLGAHVLPGLSESLEPYFEGRTLSWIRFFFGSNGVTEVSELKVNGEHIEKLSAEFSQMDWPRPESAAYLKLFVLVLPPTEERSG